MKPFLIAHGFFFEGIHDNLSLDKLKLFKLSQYAEFKRKDEYMHIVCSAGTDDQLLMGFNYYIGNRKHVNFFLSYYATDNNLPFFINHPIIQSYDVGVNHIAKFVDELNKLLETTLMAKINDGTIDNHYYRFHDQFR